MLSIYFSRLLDEVESLEAILMEDVRVERNEERCLLHLVYLFQLFVN